MTNTQSGVILDLRSRQRKTIFLFAVAVPALAFAAFAIRVALAQSWADSSDVAKVQRAIRLDPAVPEFHNKLGVLYLAEQRSTSREAVQELQRAVNLNPNVARYWSGLAMGCYSAGDQACADHAYARAMELAPSKPLYTWQAAVNHVLAGRRAEAAATAICFVLLQPDRAGEAFQLLDRGFGDYEFIWDELVKPTGSLKINMVFLDFLAKKGQYDLGAKYWLQMIATKPVVPFIQASPYMEDLLSAGRYSEAIGVWNYLLDTGAIKRPLRADKENLVFNGSFEQRSLETGFDWHRQPQTYMNVDFVDPSVHTAGSYALRVNFTAPANSEYEPVWQLVPVVPGRTYTLAAHVSSNEITSDSGPRLRVIDPKCPACLSATSDGITGTTNWRTLELPFIAPSQTEVVRISVWRPRSRSFPMEISGQFWMNNVSLRYTAFIADTGAALR